MERYFKVEGNILYPDKSMLTWGPFYFHSKDNAIAKMDAVLEDIIKWCNLKDPSLDIKPENIIRAIGNCQIVFGIKAWKDDSNLQDCKGIITNEEIFFED